MSGFIYIIRRALQEYKHDPIYKIGRTTQNNPFNYLKSRYESGFGLYAIIRTEDVSEIEAKLINTLISKPDKFELYEGRETFKLINGANVNDITILITGIIAENNKEVYLDEESELSDDEKAEPPISEEEKNDRYIRLEEQIPDNKKQLICEVINKYYDLIPDMKIKFLYSEFEKHKELSEIFDYRGEQETIDAIIYKLMNYKFDPNWCDGCSSARHQGCLSLKKKYTKKLVFNREYNRENVISKFIELYGDHKLPGNIDPDRCIKLAEFIEANGTCMHSKVPVFRHFTPYIQYYVRNCAIESHLYGEDPRVHRYEMINTYEVMVAFFALDVKIKFLSNETSWLQNLVVDANNPNYKIFSKNSL